MKYTVIYSNQKQLILLYLCPFFLFNGLSSDETFPDIKSPRSGPSAIIDFFSSDNEL